MRSTPIRLLTLSGLLLALLVTAGCGLVGGSDTVSVSDTGNMFHFKIPAEWQASTDQGFLTVYAAKELPAPDEPAKSLSILVFTSSEPTATSEPDMLDYLIDSRAEQREWKNVKKGTVKPATIGKAKGYSVDVSATGSDGETFESRYFFVRTAGGEVFLVAVAPNGKEIAEYDDELADITTEWFWHTDGSKPESGEETGTEQKP